ncbi:MAG: hypothetical protein FWC20_10635 [Oscillospiraceae bacterium]|nr:hypothetical protein [Oscillospiraceae bacterium]MCL2279845.1 hypothetical protein [Oscillospiraceae bacterium]
MVCKDRHRYFADYENLPEAQDNRSGGRHVCAGCAYEEGLKDGIKENEKKTNFSHLPKSQAGTVRHKDAKSAYSLGYAKGKISS